MDDLLEQRIEQERVAMTEAEDPQARRAHCDEFYRLIHERSEDQKERMAARLPEPWRS